MQVGAFSESDLEKATESCIRCDLTGADLSDATLVEVDLTGVNLTGTIFCKTTMPDGTKNNSSC